jgi:histidinol dehydrogenase
MIKRYLFPNHEVINEIIRRPTAQSDSLVIERVKQIFSDVRKDGDSALLRLTKELDGAELKSFWVSEKELLESEALVSSELKEAIKIARANIELFHCSQKQDQQKIETMQGVVCWRKSLPISPIGLYIPGGTAALFSTALMLAVPALVAGCTDITICTPPNKSGAINPNILYVLKSLGLTKICKLGGAQAVAALSFGTQSIAKVEKIFGPGNQYVTVAKQLASNEGVAIDLPAGPSELAIIADKSANASFLAADLLSQAEHGIDSQVLLVCTDLDLLEATEREVIEQLKLLPRREIAEKALTYSRLVQVADLEQAFKLVNCYAPEHLIIATSNAASDAEKVTSAGSVFLGHYSPESVGDYASGTNHTLPTNGHAARLSGVSLDSFMKKITFQQLSESGLLNIAKSVEVMARAEGLEAHARAVTVRREALCSK